MKGPTNNEASTSLETSSRPLGKDPVSAAEDQKRASRGYSKKMRKSKAEDMDEREAEELAQRRQVSQETAAMKKKVTRLLRVGKLIQCKPGHYAFVTVMTLARNVERGEECCRRMEAAMSLEPNSAFIFSGYDFMSSESCIPNTVEGREALWDGLAWKLLPHLLSPDPPQLLLIAPNGP